MRTILSIQAIVAVLATGAGYLSGGMSTALAALFGAAIALSNSLLLTWRMRQGKRHLHADVQRHMRTFYFSTIERYVVVGGLLAIGIGAMQLSPLPLLVAFIAGQVAWMISGLTSGNT